jgi:cell division septum initiation protein DivIVA
MAPDSSSPIDPDRILDQTFSTVRRGVDPVEVQRYLLQVATQMREARARETELERQVEQFRRRSAEADPIDPSNLTKLLGEETTRVLDAAQAAAAEIRAKAEEGVARMLRDARDEAQRMREEAESILMRKTEEADQASEMLREQSANERRQAAAESEAIIESSKQQGREMLTEAQQVRQRMLEDLARRRQLLRQQIEQLQAGRDRLVAAYDVVRDTLDVATEELHVALPEARAAAETAALNEVDSELEEAINAELGGMVEPSVPMYDAEAEALDEEIVAEAVLAEPVAAEPRPMDAFVSGSEPEPESTEAIADRGPSPVEGRHSSSVRVVRTSSGKAADVFARLRQEGEDELAQRPDPDDADAAPTADTDAPVAEAAVLEVAVPEAPMAPDVTDNAAAVQGEAAADVTDARSDAGPSDAEQAIIARRDEAIAAIESTLSRRIKRELSDEQNELLSTLGSMKGTLSAIAILPTPEDHLERYDDIALPALVDAASAGASLLDVVGRAASRTLVADLAANLSTEIVMPLRDRIERSVSEAAGDREDLAQRVRSCFREWKGQRVEQAVSLNVLAACNRGLLDRLPAGTAVHWVVAAGDPPSPDCEDNALAGAVVRGDEFPTGHTAPPLHARCHCLVLPVPD